MVNKSLRLIAILGLVFMVVGAYIALAQDMSQTMTIALSDAPNLAFVNELRNTPNTQLVMTMPDGQAQQGSDLAQLITSNLPTGTYQLVVIKPDNTSRSYSFQVLDNQQLVIPVEWTVVTAQPVVIPPTVVPTQPPMPTAIILPTEIPTQLPTVTPVILPTDIPTELPTATTVILPTDVPTQASPVSVEATEVVAATEVLPTAIIEATEEVPAPPQDVDPTEVPPDTSVLTPVVEQTEVVIDQPTEIVPTAVIEPTQILPTDIVEVTEVATQPIVETPVVEATEPVEQPTEAAPVEITEEAPVETTEEAPLDVTATVVPETVGQISGVVLYTQTQKQVAIHLNLTRLDAASEIIEATSDSSGAFQFADLPLGIYQLDASAPGFLPTRMEVRVLEGESVQLPPTTLKAGDLNQDGVIDIQDVTLIAANFNGPAAVVEADINGDGWIDIRDLSVVGSQFGLAGPLPWN